MKKRLQNWITSIIGCIIALFALVYYFIFDGLTMWNFIVLLVLAWVFISAKNTLIEGLFLNIFKVQNKE